MTTNLFFFSIKDLFKFGLALMVLCTLSLHALPDDDDDDDEDDAKVSAAEAEPVYNEEAWLNQEKPRIESILEGERARLYQEIDEKYTGERTVLFIQACIKRRLRDTNLGNFQILRVPGIEVQWQNFNAMPRKSKEAILTDVHAAAVDEATKKIDPERLKSLVEEEAEELFKMYTVGQKVSLVLRGGRGVGSYVENKTFMGLNEEWVRVGNRRIIRGDLSNLDEAKFYPEINEKAKSDYILSKKMAIDAEFQGYISDYVVKNVPKVLLDSGYVPDINKEYSSLRTSKLEYWIRKRDLVARIRAKLIAKERAKVEAVDLPEFMRAQGFILAPKLNGKEGEMEWISEKEKSRRENPQPSGQPGAGDPMMPHPMP